MTTKWLTAGVLGLLLAFVLAAASQPPGRERGDDKKIGKKDEGPDRKGSPDGKRPPPPPRWELGKIFPPFVQDQLELSEAQERQLAELQKEVRAKVLKILTVDQKKMLENMRFPGPPPGGKDGPGRRDGPPGKDGKGREPKGPPPERN